MNGFLLANKKKKKRERESKKVKKENRKGGEIRRLVHFLLHLVNSFRCYQSGIK